MRVDDEPAAPTSSEFRSPTPTVGRDSLLVENRATVGIRPATDDDAMSITEIQNALLADTTIEWRDEVYTVKSRVEWIRDHDVVLVAERGDEIIGFAAYGAFRDITIRPGYRHTVENTVHVRRDHWRMGIGRQLMAAIIAAARDRGVHVMVAAIDSENEPSIRLHERFGFTEVGRLPEVGTKFGRWLDLVLMQRILDDAARPDPSGSRGPTGR